MRLKKETRLTLAEVRGRRFYRSLLVCRDDRGQYCIVGTHSNLLAEYKRPYLDGYISSKVHISKAILKANQRGRLHPTEEDMYQSTFVRFQVVSPSELRENQPVDIYTLV